MRGQQLVLHGIYVSLAVNMTPALALVLGPGRPLLPRSPASPSASACPCRPVAAWCSRHGGDWEVLLLSIRDSGDRPRSALAAAA